MQTFARLCIKSRCYKPVGHTIPANKTYIRKFATRDPTLRGATGPSARPTRFQYRLIEDVEDLERYCPGGFHPVRIGDDLNDGRYRVVDKLGYGGYSTIWLARDLQMDKYVAVKVLTADASDDMREASLISSLGNAPDAPGKKMIRPLLDEFCVSGPNGKHRCIVTLPAGMSLFDAKEASTFGLFQPNVARSIIAQLIQGVAFLHVQSIVHGDLHLGNILAQMPQSIDGLSTAELYEKFGDPGPEAVIRVDGKPLANGVPSHVFLSGWFGTRSNEINLDQGRIFLSDFGESFNPQKEPRYNSKTLPLLQPPEARFSDEPLSFPSDIWTLACTVWEILGARPLFETFFPSADRVTAEQVEVLGILPPEWWAKWDKRLDWFNEEGELDVDPEQFMAKDRVRRTWNIRFEFSIQEPRAKAGLEIVGEEERRSLEVMLLSMLRFRPGERATAQEVLQCEWMRNWGLPGLKRC